MDSPSGGTDWRAVVCNAPPKCMQGRVSHCTALPLCFTSPSLLSVFIFLIWVWVLLQTEVLSASGDSCLNAAVLSLQPKQGKLRRARQTAKSCVAICCQIGCYDDGNSSSGGGGGACNKTTVFNSKQEGKRIEKCKQAGAKDAKRVLWSHWEHEFVSGDVHFSFANWKLVVFLSAW